MASKPPRYTILFRPSALRDFRKLSRDLQARLTPKIDALAHNPRPAGAEKLTGSENEYRIRVGDYRILYEIQDASLLLYVFRFAHRREVHRRR